jgi:ABC-type polysaccharide/polyol phosphate export permease
VATAGAAISLLLLWFISVTILNQPDPPFALLVLGILGVALGFVLFGIAGVRTGVPSRTVGSLLLAVVATIIGWIALGFVVYGGAPPEWTSPAVGVLMSLLLLAIGYTLHTSRSTVRTEDSARDSPVR